MSAWRLKEGEMTFKMLAGIVALCAVAALQAKAQSASDKAALKGLAPVAVLSNTSAGNAALGANYTVTGGIQTGAIVQPTLLPFAEQQQQALRDVFITGRNLAELSDGLGTTLGSAYLARAHYIDRQHFTNLSQEIANVIAYVDAATSANSGSAKYFFANETKDGKTAVSAETIAILTEIGGTADIFGKAYGLAAGSAGANPYGNSRPFLTEPSLTRIVGFDYFHSPADNIDYDRGPMMNLVKSPSYPSGHATYGYSGAILLGVLVPERYAQMIARAAEYGNDRIIVGAHYAMDVLGARTLALYDMAHLLANDPDYVGQSFKGTPAIGDFQAVMKKARAEMTAALEAGCGKTIEACAGEDTGRFSDAATDETFYDATQTYNLPVVYAKNAGVVEDVGKNAREAGYLLTVAFPSLTLEQADEILTETEGPGGGFLDDGSGFGVYSRLNLYAAVERAMQVAAKK